MWPALAAHGGTLLLNARRNATLPVCTETAHRNAPRVPRRTVALHQVAGRGLTDLRTFQVLSDSRCGCRSGAPKNGLPSTCAGEHATRLWTDSRGRTGMLAAAQQSLGRCDAAHRPHETHDFPVAFQNPIYRSRMRPA
ncbi:hypothetical protein OH77DRAFT_376824 [Trametes cingulata]|nr:hypothetical protein OH77DRAFT_376824 [Trametes cingulata]